MSVFNAYHQRLNFTFEVEKDKCINFLDTTVRWGGGNLITNWYRKPTFSGRYINFLSVLKYKINCINNLIVRAILLSDEKFHTDNIKIIKEILTNNNFLSQIINKYIKKRLHVLNNNNNYNNNNFSDGKKDNDNNKKNLI